MILRIEYEKCVVQAGLEDIKMEFWRLRMGLGHMNLAL